MTTMDDTDHDQGGTGARKRVIRLPLLPLAPFILLLHPSNLLFSLRGVLSATIMTPIYKSHLYLTLALLPSYYSLVGIFAQGSICHESRMGFQSFMNCATSW